MEQRPATVSAADAKSESRLTLLGTLHHDPHGLHRTRCALRRLKPEILLLELSPFGWAFRNRFRRHYTRLLLNNLRKVCCRRRIALRRAFRHPEILSIYRKLQMPFEYRAAARFCQEHPASLHLIDLSRYSCLHIRNWPELVAAANLDLLLDVPRTRASIADQYQTAAHSLKTDRSDPKPAGRRPLPTCTAAPEIRRERYLARQVEKAMALYAGRSCLYIGGWEHLRHRPATPSLAQALQRHAPRLLLLNAFSEPAAGGR